MTLAGVSLDDMMVSWQRALAAANAPRKTILTYRYGVRALRAFLVRQQHALTLETITRADMEAFVADRFTVNKPTTVSTYFASCLLFFRWCAEEGEIAASPMERMRTPRVPETLSPVLSPDQIRAVLRACEGNGFEERRDLALLRVLLATGMRRAELTHLRVEDVDLAELVARSVVKGGREHLFPLGRKAAAALDRYLRTRARHPHADLPALWLGKRGALGYSGVYEVIRHRATQAGLPHVWPHLFRHTYADGWLAAGGSEQGLMRNIGWRSRAMLDHYGKSVGDRRARDEYQRLQPGDDY